MQIWLICCSKLKTHVTRAQIKITMKEVLQRLTTLEKAIRQQSALMKSVLGVPEAAQYLCVSCSYLYKLTSQGQIPCYKPNGKKVYFRRDELDKWLLRNRKISQEELEQQAVDYCLQRGKIKLR